MEVKFFCTEVGFESVGALIVQSMELGFEASLDEDGVAALKCC